MPAITATHFSKWHLAGVVLTLGCILGQPYLPQKRVQIFPKMGTAVSLYSDDTWGGKSSATWIKEDQGSWRCRLVQSEFYPVCGFSVSLQGQYERQLIHDYSRYDALDVTINYRGEAPELRVYLRNHNPAYSDISDDDSFKFNYFNLETNEINKGVARIKLSEFMVAQWWLEERNIPRELAAPELSNIVAMGIDLPSPHVFGEHEISVEKFELVGRWLPKAVLYGWMLALWMMLLTVESLGVLLLKPHRDRKDKSAAETRRNNEVTERKKTQARQTICSRVELTPLVEKCYRKLPANSPISLLLLHFEDLSNQPRATLTSEADDYPVDQLIQLVQQEIHTSDILARWNENTLLLLCPNITLSAANKLAERLLKGIAVLTFGPTSSARFNINIGVACGDALQTFMPLLQHADEALYQAKKEGSNHIAQYSAQT